MVPHSGTPLKSSRPPSRGFALPSVVLALVILAVLITGALYMAAQESRIGWSSEQASVAFNVTERSMDQVLTNWDSSVYSLLSDWSSATTTGVFPEGTWSAEVTKMTDFFYYVDVTAVVTLGGALRAGATHRIAAITHVSSAGLNPPAALTTRGVVSVRGNAAVIGLDVDPPSWSVCTEPPENKPGIATDMTSTMGTQGQGSITGVPSVFRDPAIADSTFTKFGDVIWDDLVRMADIVPSPGSLNVDASFNVDGTCNYTDLENWGDPETPGSECEDYFPIIFVNGDARIQAGGSGQGILLVAGDLNLRGSFAFYGIILVQGTFETQGNGNRIFGGVMARNATLEDQTLTGGSVIQYSHCAVDRAILNSNLTRARRLPNRGWVDMSYLIF